MEPFSSDAAYELRTILTRIRGELDLVLQSGVAEPPRSQLEGIQRELELLSRVCGRLLLVARLDPPTRDADFLDARVDIEDVMAELLDQMLPFARDRGVRLERGASAPSRIRGSRPLLVEALLNLFDNAIRFTPAGGAVSVSSEANGTAVRLSVEDEGPGVPPDERERIFLPFYRVPRAAGDEGEEGKGLGLSIVRAVARAHGGRVELTDAPRGGSVFSLVLPASRTG